MSLCLRSKRQPQLRRGAVAVAVLRSRHRPAIRPPGGRLHVVDQSAWFQPRLQKLDATGADVSAAFRASNRLLLSPPTPINSTFQLLLAVNTVTNRVYVSDDLVHVHALSSGGALLQTSRTFGYIVGVALGRSSQLLVVGGLAGGACAGQEQSAACGGQLDAAVR